MVKFYFLKKSIFENYVEIVIFLNEIV